MVIGPYLMGWQRLERFLRFVLESSGSLSLFGDQDDKLFLEKMAEQKNSSWVNVR